MIDFDKANKLLTLIANFGVVAGIFFLAVEIRQNQEMLERDAEERQLDREMRVADFSAFAVSRYGQIRRWNVEDPELNAIWANGLAGGSQSPEDQRRFSRMCEERLWAEVLMWERSQILDRQLWLDTIVGELQDDLQVYPGLRDCWEPRMSTLTRWGYGEFVEAINAGLTDAQK